ncbi:MAG: hypothetical protein Q7V01_14880 [Vicinamibacterales bacterium]|nr:hypothetical protein [Vicinamibacterales bacterium]
MTPNARQLIGLGGLVCVLAVVVWWQSGRGGTAGSAARPLQTAQAVVAARPGPAADVPVVALALLETARSEPVDSGRDPFRFGSGSRRPAANDGASSGLEPAVRPRDPQAEIVPAAPPGPPPLPPITLKFIGIVRKTGQDAPIAVLSDARGIYHGREGDLIEGRYRIVRIGNETIELTYADGRGRQLIRLSGS